MERECLHQHHRYEQPIIRANDGLDFGVLFGLLFRLLDNWIHNLLSSEEMPNTTSVELISKSVEQGIEDGICLCNDWKHLWE